MFRASLCKRSCLSVSLCACGTLYARVKLDYYVVPPHHLQRGNQAPRTKVVQSMTQADSPITMSRRETSRSKFSKRQIDGNGEDHLLGQKRIVVLEDDLSRLPLRRRGGG